LPDGANYILAALIFIGIILYEFGGRSSDKDGKDAGNQDEGGKLLPDLGTNRLIRLV
jgi:hypothetical protein